MEADKWALFQILDKMENAENPLPEKATILAKHIVMAFDIWKRRMLKEDISDLRFFSNAGIQEIKDYAEKVYGDWKIFLPTIVDTEFSTKFTYRDMAGNKHQNSLEEVLIHLTHHAAYHRGQIQTALKEAGIEPAKIDLIIPFRSN